MVHSPITDDTILVVNELTGKKIKRVSKLLLTCSVTELNNNLIKDINDGGLKDVWNDSKLLVSETGVRLFYMINWKSSHQGTNKCVDVNVHYQLTITTNIK